MDQFLKKYQAKAPSEGVDPLGYYLPPFAYADHFRTDDAPLHAGEPITVGAVRYPGIRIHDARVIRLLEVRIAGLGRLI